MVLGLGVDALECCGEGAKACLHRIVSRFRTADLGADRSEGLQTALNDRCCIQNLRPLWVPSRHLTVLLRDAGLVSDILQAHKYEQVFQERAGSTDTI